MTERNIVITGCSSGIGLCVAKGLQERGWRVFATARKPEDVIRLQDEGLEALQLDVSDSESIHTAVSIILSRTGGKIDAIFNNAGYGQPGAVEHLSRESLREQFETNLFGAVELTNLLIPIMRQQGHGRVIFNSSILGFAAMPMRGAYNASKFAMEGLVDTLRLELSGSGVYPVLVEPGPIKSKFRPNAYLAYQKHIAPKIAEVKETTHKVIYESLEARLTKQGAAVPFTLGPEAVLAAVVHALESKRPKARYPVTVPTKAFAILKRILPQRLLDWACLKAGT
ncbi:SDR family NAD(P)-dependent oxidoreductase [Leeia sp. TBRC 13508]|uniref:SDR family NAD(P)-dependent oxidoreductase n=1 Tax=Leeia speluncae TaxID=2884804 RepID=A0ABS8D6B5_9NEIS|nr:SDR family NAD(P)-dependent oxidoreductase [Leeia speluncae]MCB6183724.1 SDR family NAD(P)-dependent oxidoreductase [Leeia speluncae]